jgi:hypothetical protein
MRERTISGAPDVQPIGRAWGARFALEMAEGLLLASIAVLTAWSGYQAALLNTDSAISYGTTQALRSQSQAASTLAGQQMLYDATTFDTWLVAAQANNVELMSFIERRFRPEFRVAFDAWLTTDPLHNSTAPPGPAAMPQYRNANMDKASALDRSASASFDLGNHQRDSSDDFVRATVLLAVALFLTALSQRFEIAGVRLTILVVAFLVFAYGGYTALTVPR